jgi:hypothetical protein
MVAKILKKIENKANSHFSKALVTQALFRRKIPLQLFDFDLMYRSSFYF